ncbi:hypothetical protein AB6G31_22510 [Providencia hangzhouensis]|uniref:hypothetical protein n=1 Tax=Providencia TaxID=586 RepID=UPI001C5B1DDB|nr:hypothetical protein [Providencia sp. R33]QXX85151.1 hypothetical protein J6836_22620 [Providencia sp. R33]
MNNIENDVADIIEEQRFEFAYQDLCKIKHGVKTRYFAEKIGLLVWFLTLTVGSAWLIMTNLPIVVLVVPVVLVYWCLSITLFFQLKLFLFLNSEWKLNALLHQYSPMNVELYRALQENVRYSPEHFLVELKIWLAKESQYFGERPKSFAKKGLDFTEREI